MTPTLATFMVGYFVSVYKRERRGGQSKPVALGAALFVVATIYGIGYVIETYT